jgi:hypothetical protein
VVPPSAVVVASAAGWVVEELVEGVVEVVVGEAGAALVVPGAGRVVVLGVPLLPVARVADESDELLGRGVDGRATVRVGEGRDEEELGDGLGDGWAVAGAAGGFVLGRAPSPKAQPSTDPGRGSYVAAPSAE